MTYKCVSCIEQYVKAAASIESEEERTSLFERTVFDGVTLVPFWQSHTVFGQVMFQCITLPVCINHIQEKKQSPQEKAAAGGLAVPGGL
ncbi:MAG TPA: hypothetical protein VH164_02510 [Ktedonobacteraceae bacterium]|nr:hypothetical protein [Ktedonobacteraceae bacterium]